MPHLTFPLSLDGMVVQARFGVNGPKTATLVQAGQPVPRPVLVRALVDSGTNVTAIARHVSQQLGLELLVQGSSQTAAALVKVNLYRASMTIYGASGIAGPALVLPDLLVSELTTPLPNVDALIGMHVLRECLLVFDGPGQQFILGF